MCPKKRWENFPKHTTLSGRPINIYLSLFLLTLFPLLLALLFKMVAIFYAVVAYKNRILVEVEFTPARVYVDAALVMLVVC